MHMAIHSGLVEPYIEGKTNSFSEDFSIDSMFLV